MGRSSKGNNSTGKSGDSSHLLKTKLCTLFAEGRCHYGGRCFFSHSPAELVSRPNLRKTSLCKEFHKTQSCPRGGDCQYAHSAKELVNKAAMCKWHLNGSCSHQDRCRFAHHLAELEDEEQLTRCSSSAASPVQTPSVHTDDLDALVLDLLNHLMLDHPPSPLYASTPLVDLSLDLHH